MFSDLLADLAGGGSAIPPARQGEGKGAGLGLHDALQPGDSQAPPSLTPRPTGLTIDVKLKWRRWKATPWLYAEIPEELESWAASEAATRRAYKRYLGERPRFQTDELKNETVGLIGEYAVASLLRKRPDVALRRGGDGGADLILAGRMVDVKTIARTVVPQPHYSCLVVKGQLPSKQDDEVLAFLSYTTTSRLVFALGYLAVGEFRARAVLREDGPMPPRWEVRVSDLKPIGDLLRGYCDWYNTEYCRLMNEGAESCPGYAPGPDGGCRRWADA